MLSNFKSLQSGEKKKEKKKTRNQSIELKALIATSSILVGNETDLFRFMQTALEKNGDRDGERERKTKKNTNNRLPKK